jgi:hypothetical protein
VGEEGKGGGSGRREGSRRGEGRGRGGREEVGREGHLGGAARGAMAWLLLSVRSLHAC